MTNKVKELIRSGKTALGTMIAEVGIPEVARVMAVAGFDFVIIDTEHSPFSFETVTNIVRAGKTMGIPCFARVPDAEYHLIARTLDAGASGIMVPRVETLNKVEEVIRAAKYPPVGERGFGARTIITDYQNTPVRDLAAQQNQDTLVILQIERRRAIENIDSLLSVAGIDVALIGPNDLSISLGVPGDEDNPIMVEAIQKVVEACERHGIVSGIHLGDMKRLLFWKERGMRFLMYSTDAKFLLSAASASVKDIRETM